MKKRTPIVNLIGWLFVTIMLGSLVWILTHNLGWVLWASAWPAFFALLALITPAKPGRAQNLTGHPEGRIILTKEKQ